MHQHSSFALQPAALFGAVLLLLPVALLLVSRALARSHTARHHERHGWSWERMCGPAPSPAPKWRDGVFFAPASSKRNAAICVQASFERDLEACFSEVSNLRHDSVLWSEPQLFCIEATLEPNATPFTGGVVKLHLTLTSSNKPGVTRTELRGVFEPALTRSRPVSEVDTLHRALNTPLMRSYEEAGFSSDEMIEIETAHRGAATIAQRLLHGLGAPHLAEALDGANLALLVSRRL